MFFTHFSLLLAILFVSKKQPFSFLRDFAFIVPLARTPFPTALSKPVPFRNLSDRVLRDASPVALPTSLVSIRWPLSQLVINKMIRAMSEGNT